MSSQILFGDYQSFVFKTQDNHLTKEAFLKLVKKKFKHQKKFRFYKNNNSASTAYFYEILITKKKVVKEFTFDSIMSERGVRV